MFEVNKVIKAIKYIPIKLGRVKKVFTEQPTVFSASCYTPKINHLQIPQSDMENKICP